MEKQGRSTANAVPMKYKSRRLGTFVKDSALHRNSHSCRSTLAECQITNAEVIAATNKVYDEGVVKARHAHNKALVGKERKKDPERQSSRIPGKNRDQVPKSGVLTNSSGKKQGAILLEVKRPSCENKQKSKITPGIEERPNIGEQEAKSVTTIGKQNLLRLAKDSAPVAHAKTKRKRGNPNRIESKTKQRHCYKLNDFCFECSSDHSQHNNRKIMPNMKATQKLNFVSADSILKYLSSKSSFNASFNTSVISQAAHSISYSDFETPSMSSRSSSSISSRISFDTVATQSISTNKQLSEKIDLTSTALAQRSKENFHCTNRLGFRRDQNGGKRNMLNFDSKAIEQITKDLGRTSFDANERKYDDLGKRKKKKQKASLRQSCIATEYEKVNHSPQRCLVLTSRRVENKSSRKENLIKLDELPAVSLPTNSPKKLADSNLTIRDLYSLQHVLSDTQNGTVIAGYRRSDGTRVAIKRIAKSQTIRWGMLDGKVVPLELSLICQVNEVRHSGIVEIIEWHETTEAFILVMARPHPSIDLYDHVTKQKRLKEPVAKRIINQVVAALSHCQKMGVFHRDVKLENILFNPATLETVLIDFGCGDYSRLGPYAEFAGTLEYYPPEWFLDKKYNAQSATVWSIGVLLYSLLCGNLPFSSSKDIVTKVPTKFPADISENARHLIGETMKKNPDERILLKSISSHPWLLNSVENSKNVRLTGET